MNKEFIMRGKTAKGLTEVLNFSGYKPGYAYRLVEFRLFPSTMGGPTADSHLSGVITAGKTALDPQNPDFSIEGCIGTSLFKNDSNDVYPTSSTSIVNDLFLITQNLKLTVYNVEAHDVNWQCRFVAEKMTGPEEAVANYKQFTISDGS